MSNVKSNLLVLELFVRNEPVGVQNAPSGSGGEDILNDKPQL